MKSTNNRFTKTTNTRPGFIKLIGARKFKITNGPNGLKIQIINQRVIFKNEFKNWYHLFQDFEKL